MWKNVVVERQTPHVLWTVRTAKRPARRGPGPEMGLLDRKPPRPLRDRFDFDGLRFARCENRIRHSSESLQR